MSIHNIRFYGELTKIILQLSSDTLLICSTEWCVQKMQMEQSDLGLCYLLRPICICVCCYVRDKNRYWDAVDIVFKDSDQHEYYKSK